MLYASSECSITYAFTPVSKASRIRKPATPQIALSGAARTTSRRASPAISTATARSLSGRFPLGLRAIRCNSTPQPWQRRPSIMVNHGWLLLRGRNTKKKLHTNAATSKSRSSRGGQEIAQLRLLVRRQVAPIAHRAKFIHQPRSGIQMWAHRRHKQSPANRAEDGSHRQLWNQPEPLTYPDSRLPRRSSIKLRRASDVFTHQRRENIFRRNGVPSFT